MAGSTYSTRLRFELITTGEQSGSWGTTTNTNLGTLIEEAIAGVASVTHDNTANYTLTSINGGTDESRHMILEIGGALTANRNVICPSQEKLYIVKNATSGGFDIIIKTLAGTGITIPNGKSMIVYCDATNVVDGINNFPAGTTVNSVAIVTESGVQTLTSKTINLASNTLTGTTAQFNTALSDGDFVTLAGTETLSNKTHQNTFNLLSTDAGAAAGPKLDVYRNSASPAASDVMGAVEFNGEDSGSNKTLYSQIYSTIIDPTNGSEDGRMVLEVTNNASGATVLDLRAGVQVGAPTGGDKGAGTLNASGLYIDNNSVGYHNADGGQTWTSTDAGSAVGPTLILDRNSASPADNDLAGTLQFLGRNDAAASKQMALLYTKWLDVTAATEDSQMIFRTTLAGGNNDAMKLGSGLVVGAPTGGDLGVGTINATAISINNSDVPYLNADGGITFTDTDAGAAVGPVLDLYRNSASPAAADVLGNITFSGEDGGGNKTTYTELRAEIVDETGGTEDGQLNFRTIRGGAEADRMVLRGGLMLPDESVSGADKGNGTINATGLYVAGVKVNPITEATMVDATNGGANDLTEIDFTSIPSGTKRITIMFDQVDLNGTNDIIVQIGYSGGFETTGYVSEGTLSGTSGTASGTSTIGFMIERASTNDNYFTGLMTLVLADSGTNLWIESHAGGGGGTFNNSYQGGGRKALTGELDRVRITRSVTNKFDGGNVNISYE